jgi:hypothetical protein
VNSVCISTTINGVTVRLDAEAYGEDSIPDVIADFKALVRAIPLTRLQRFKLWVRGIKL